MPETKPKYRYYAFDGKRLPYEVDFKSISHSVAIWHKGIRFTRYFLKGETPEIMVCSSVNIRMASSKFMMFIKIENNETKK